MRKSYGVRAVQGLTKSPLVRLALTIRPVQYGPSRLMTKYNLTYVESLSSTRDLKKLPNYEKMHLLTVYCILKKIGIHTQALFLTCVWVHAQKSVKFKQGR